MIPLAVIAVTVYGVCYVLVHMVACAQHTHN